MELEIAPDLSLPLDAVTQTIAILAKRRVGKTYLARRLAEQIYKAGVQEVIIDPKGDWWGIRSSASGKRPGLPIVILGGERGDVPLEPSAGEVVATMVVEERVSVLLDLSLLRKHEVSTFMSAFLETLYRLKAREKHRTPLMLIIDEADAIAPQNPQQGGNEARMLGAAEDIVRRGGQRGIGCTLITQRSAVLNKNVLTQAQLLVVLRLIAPQDVKAIKAWIVERGDEETLPCPHCLVHGIPTCELCHGTKRATKPTIMFHSLGRLPVGDAWYWSPGWPDDDGIFCRSHTHKIETFDSGATPKAGEKRAEPRNLADVDLEALRRQMAETIERAKADDPKLLRKRIAELEKQIDAGARVIAKAAAVQVQPVEVPVVRAEDLRRLDDLAKRVEKAASPALDRLTTIADRIAEFSQHVEGLRDRIGESVSARAATGALAKPLRRAFPTMTGAIAAAQAEGMKVRTPQIVSAPKKPSSAAAAQIGRLEPGGLMGELDAPLNDGEMSKGEIRVLTAVIQHEDGATREQISVLVQLKQSTRRLYLQRLARRGFVKTKAEQPGLFFATDAGRAALPAIEPLPTGAALREHWLSRLPDGERRVLEVLLSAYPDELELGDLSERVELRQSTRRLYVQRLARRKLVIRHGKTVRASPTLFDQVTGNGARA